MNVHTVTISSEERKLKSLRMSGVLQSYDMFDGRVYHNAQIMKAIVADEKKNPDADIFSGSIKAPLIDAEVSKIAPEQVISPKEVELVGYNTEREEGQE